MYDSTYSQTTTDLEFLSQYFTGQVIEIYYYSGQLYNNSIQIKR